MTVNVLGSRHAQQHHAFIIAPELFADKLHFSVRRAARYSAHGDMLPAQPITRDDLQPDTSATELECAIVAARIIGAHHAFRDPMLIRSNIRLRPHDGGSTAPARAFSATSARA